MPLSADPTTSPSLQIYATLQRAFDHFNRELFAANLPPCLLTLRSSARHYGYHHAERFIAGHGARLDELGLNPGHFITRPVEEVLSTLVHEMVHHWQHHHGQPTRSNPHNRQWAQHMQGLGLAPSNTGLPGGKPTGRTVSHYILPDGAFLTSCRALLATGLTLPWMDRHLPTSAGHAERAQQRQEALRAAGIDLQLTPPPLHALPMQPNGQPPVVLPVPSLSPVRVKFSCPQCGARAWAASDTALVCGECEVGMEGL